MPSPSSRAQRESRQTLAILALALVLRGFVLLIVLTSHPASWLFTRGVEMGLIGHSIATGQGIASPFVANVATGPTAFFGPGYPLFVGAIFKFFGSYTLASSAAILTVQLIVNLVTIWTIMYIARVLFDQRAAVLAGLFWTVSIPLLWLPTIFWETGFSVCLLTGLVALALRCRRTPHTALWIAIGLWCGVAALFNPALLTAIGAIVVWLVWQTRGLKVLLAVLTFCVILAPWAIRNERVFHAFIPLRSNLGFELWMGNHPGASGYLEENNFPTFNQHELDEYTRKGEVAYTADKGHIALDSIKQQPGAFAARSAGRFFRFWTGSGSRSGSAIYVMHACMTTLLGIAGLWLLVRRKRGELAILFAAPLLLFPLPYYLTHAEFRYRIVIDPLLTLLSAYALAAASRVLVQESASAVVVAEPEVVCG